MMETRRRFIIATIAAVVFIGLIIFAVPIGFTRVGEQAFAAKDWQKAKQYFSYALILNPWNKPLYEKKGQAEYWLGDFENAARSYEKAVRKNIDKKSYYGWLGTIHFAKGDYEKAVEAYKRLGSLDTYGAKEMNALAAAELEAGNTEEASRLLLLAMIRASRDGDKQTLAKVFNNLALVAVKSNPPQLAVAESYMKNAVKLWPANPLLYISLGEVYEHAGKNAEAIKVYEKALELAPTSSNPRVPVEINKVNQRLPALRGE